MATLVDQASAGKFVAGQGLIQLVSGVGGVESRSGTFGAFPFVAAGFSGSTPAAARMGFSRIDVAADRLTVKYVAADNGAVMDTFTIEKEATLPQFYVVDRTTSRVDQLAPSGAQLGLAPLPAAVAVPQGIAASPDGSRLWVLGAGGAVSVYDAGMRRLGAWTATGLVRPTGIAVAASSFALSATVRDPQGITDPPVNTVARSVRSAWVAWAIAKR